MQVNRSVALRSVMTLVVFLYCGSLANSADSAFPLLTGYGFNWLDPATASCDRLPVSDIRQIKSCEFHPTGAFGLDHPYHACKIAQRREFLIFNSVDACMEALETMHANAP
jgi:hypothetical protein